MKKQTLKSLIIQLSKENSLITQFTSFVAVEKRVCIAVNSCYLYLPINKITLALTVADTIHILGLAEQAGAQRQGRQAAGLSVRAHGDLSVRYMCYYF